MNRIRGNARMDFDAAERRDEQSEATVDGIYRMKLRKETARRLRKLLKYCTYAPLRAQLGLVETALQACAAERPVRLPGTDGTPRILQIARRIAAQGERGLELSSIEAEIAALDAANTLEMREILALPSALRIAMCEGFLSVAETGRRIESAKTAAEKWVSAGGSTRCDQDEVFFEHAARLCMHNGDTETYAELTRRVRECGQRLEWLVERAHRIEADAGMRLDNLLHLMRILNAVDWSKRLGRVSATEAELNADAIYARSDDDTRALVRDAVGEIARALREPEIVVVRRALQLCVQEGLPTACACFLEDSGRKKLCASFEKRARIRRVVPDPTGRIVVCILIALGATVFGIAARMFEKKWLLLLVPPLAWVAAERLAAFLLPKFARPLRLPKLKLEAVPADARTLVVLPVLLSNAARVREAVARMEALGCLEKDENVDFLLLGDNCDADSEQLPEDTEIVAAAETGVAALNRRAEREKYFVLIRRRAYREKDGRWMGENRKRGALVALNRVLLGGDPNVFAHGDLPKRDYRYVVTLDADTEYLPGTVQKLVGAMLHPLNARYAVLQPDMQLTADASDNLFVRTVYGMGGLDAYPTAVSGFFQDLCGRGSFAGKGIYDVRRFAEATDGTLPDAEILSHDLIEGILAGAGNLCDVHFYDGCPENLRADLKRAHRWTRGDWQLLRVLFCMRTAAADRIRIVGNLLRSLSAPGMTLLLILSAWLDAPKAFLFALTAAYLEPLLHPIHADAWRRSMLELALLPVRGFYTLDAAARSVWRLLVSRKHLMDWVPSAEASGGAKHISIPGRIAAILILPALLRPLWLPAAIALAALFWIGTGWADDLARAETAEQLSETQIRELKALGRRTWHFFEYVVPEDGNGLPPDNLQVDPPVGAAHRTSPTNIALYLMSCLAAEKLGYIDGEAMLRRMRACVTTLESLEKWNGQLYNWYDTDTRMPMRPRYVSSVDGGNLAAALLLCAQAVPDAILSARLRNLAKEMDFRTLYDETRDLFVIGVDAENGSASRSYYDLYASESRILSFTAMMLGQAPVRHWQRLGRPEARFGKRCALLSWSGTMFEYLMPELILGSPAQSLAGRTCRTVVEMQMAHGRRFDLPWGVSESGYCAFDRSLNYQYRAFGLRELALSDAAQAEVIAPYAAALALAVRPAAAAENLTRMAALDLAGEYGMYEAADDRDGAVRVVRSYMAHHQGMLLCAICNALTQNALQRTFMEIPQAKALRLLLQEKAGKHMRKRAPQKRQPVPRRVPSLAYAPAADGEIQLLHGAGTTALASSHGAVFVRSGDLLWNRFSGDLCATDEGLYVHLRVDGKDTVIAGHPEFDAGCARFRAELDGISAKLTVTVSPETGALFLIVDLKNLSNTAQEAEIAACTPVALAEERDMRAHPVFQNLFVESAPVGANGIVFRRRPREAGKEFPELVFVCTEDAEAETDLDVLVGRRGACGTSGGIAARFTGTFDCTLNPCAALKTRVYLESGEEKKLHFAMCVSEREADLACAGRALQLARTQARSLIEFSFEDAEEYRLCQRAAALLFDARLRPQIDGTACGPAPRELLWRAGISGDLPILATRIEEQAQMPLVRQIFRLREFYTMMGIRTDLALIASEGGDYRRDLAESLRLVAGDDTHIFILDAAADADSCAAVTRAAALCFSGTRDLRTQLREIADARRKIDGCAYAPMESREMELPKIERFNGIGGFDGETYCILLKNDRIPPAPWSNLVASESAGALLTERGGGFAWNGSSRSSRITPFHNDTLCEGWGWMFYLADHENRRWTRLLPGDVPNTDYLVRFAADECCWQGRTGNFSFEVRARATDAGVLFELELRNAGRETEKPELVGLVDWLMGTDVSDAAALRVWAQGGACFASGSAEKIGCWMADSVSARPGCTRREFLADGDMMSPHGFDRLRRGSSGWTLCVPVKLHAGEMRTVRFALEAFADMDAALTRVRTFRNGAEPERFQATTDTLRIETPDTALNALANAFLPAQNLNCRIRARTGLQQPGGAFGFRDQLQDMLPLIYTDPRRVRSHILDCAARQFTAGDVLHWWHPPYTGVRTDIRDDLLFLPYVTAKYVRVTEDTGILRETVSFLTDIEIPEGNPDIYARMTPSEITATLHEHCMRAIRRAAATGSHGLCEMGGGDWNDGMNRVGGESVWLTEFLAVCAERYAEIAPEEADRNWLMELNKRLKAALEESGWGGDRYLRAYARGGAVLGSAGNAECAIDGISQAWAVFAGLDKNRCRTALDTAWRELVDEKIGIIRLLNPPFTGKTVDPGYIAAYPPGIRENGGQYTHAACWLLIALIRMGEEERAHRALEMLLPYTHPVETYRGEPYGMAADVCADALHSGRAGWTWYTGSAAWMRMAIFELLGFERRGNRVRVCALLGGWEETAITLKFGNSAYRLISRRDAKEIQLDGREITDEYVTLLDDGHDHTVVFPAR